MAAVVSPVLARSTVWTVTPKNLDCGPFVFAVTNSPTHGGVCFQVTITAKQGKVPPQSVGSIGFVRLTDRTQTIGPLTTETPMVLKKTDRVWTATFIAPPELLRNPEACLVLEVGPAAGRSVASADFFTLKLRDFNK